MPGYRIDDIPSVPQNTVPFIPNILFQNKGRGRKPKENQLSKVHVENVP